jgi:hypothetical protein
VAYELSRIAHEAAGRAVASRSVSSSFALSGPAVFEELFEFRDDPAEIHRRLAYDMHRFWEANDVVLQRLFLALRIAAVALIIEIAVLLASVTDTLV